MSNQWLVRVGDKVSKPMSSEQVKKYYKEGKISTAAVLSRDGKNWNTIAKLMRRSAIAGGNKATRATPLRRTVLHCRCGKRLTANSEYIGKKARCPGCGVVLTIGSDSHYGAVQTIQSGKPDDMKNPQLRQQVSNARLDRVPHANQSTGKIVSDDSTNISTTAGKLIAGICLVNVLWFISLFIPIPTVIPTLILVNVGYGLACLLFNDSLEKKRWQRFWHGDALVCAVCMGSLVIHTIAKYGNQSISTMPPNEIASQQMIFWLAFVVCVVVGPAIGLLNVSLHDDEDRPKYESAKTVNGVSDEKNLVDLWKSLTCPDEILRDRALRVLKNTDIVPIAAIPDIITAFKMKGVGKHIVSVVNLAKNALTGLGAVALPAAQKLLKEEQSRSMLFRDVILIKRTQKLICDLQEENRNSNAFMSRSNS